MDYLRNPFDVGSLFLRWLFKPMGCEFAITTTSLVLGAVAVAGSAYGEISGQGWDFGLGKGLKNMFNPEMPEYQNPELPQLPEAPEAPTPVEKGEEGIRKDSMQRTAKKQRSLYATTRGQPRSSEMTLGGIQKTLA